MLNPFSANSNEKDERIIFWDNFNDYEDSSFYDFLSFANQYLKKATIILITKVDPIIEGITSIPSIKIEGLKNDALEYAKKAKAIAKEMDWNAKEVDALLTELNTK